MKKILISILIIAFSINAANAQVERSQTVQGGGTGPYKALVVADKSLPDFTIYRPADLKAAVAAEGKLPVMLYGNGACANDNQQMRYLLNEVVSYGYIAIAIGPYDEEDVDANWYRVFHPEAAKAYREEQAAKAAEAAKAARKNKKAAPAPVVRRGTSSEQLLEAMDWISRQNANPESEYYHMIDVDKVVAMGQSCGGAQALAVSYDPRIKTTIMMNSGMGDAAMAGASKASLDNLHAPIFYIIGGPTDIAYNNAVKDFQTIKEELTVMINTTEGHHGTYHKEYGGEYSIAIRKWLDWQLKGKVGEAGLFLDPDYIKLRFPEWTLDFKNIK